METVAGDRLSSTLNRDALSTPQRNETPRAMLYIETPSHHFLRDKFFDSGTVPTGGDDLQAPWRHVRDSFARLNVPVHTLDMLPDTAEPGVKKVVFSVSGQQRYDVLARTKDVILSAYLALECPAVEPRIYRRLPTVAKHFRRILSWSDSDALLPFTGTRVPTQRFLWPQSYSQVHETHWARRDRGFLVMINSNKLPRLYVKELYTARLAAVEYFHRYGEIDLYGPNWNRMPNRVGKTWIPATAMRMYRVLWEGKQRIRPNPIYAAAAEAWKGKAASKAETLSRYNFALCFENQALKGWITEKLFDCLFAGTVPVYWGATDVNDFVPAEAFVDMRQFKDFGELRYFLHQLSPTEVQRYRDAGRAFVNSDRFQPFRMQTLSALFARIVAEDTGITESTPE